MNPNRRALISLIVCGLVWPWGACKQTYTPPAIKANLNLLVVNGVLNGGPGQPTTIYLSRSQEIGDSILAPPIPELQAKILIQGEGGDTYNLQEQGNGTYASGNLTLNTAHKYRLQITTAGGAQYISDYVSIQQTPPIDSLTWQQRGDVTVYLNTHDPANQSHYYRWDYMETWEYHSPLQTLLGVKNHLIYFTDSTNQTQVCWESDNSTNILLGSSAGLGADVISQAPVATVTQTASKLSARYSILVSQYVLTQPAYQYWQILQKNTQQTGTLFDPQPSQLTGNFHRVNNPSEPVIGYMSASSITQKRIFIGNSQVSGWDTVALACEQKEIPQDPNNFAFYNYPDTTFSPYYFVTTGSLIMLARSECVNCLLRGGTNQKPAYW
ncbi:MAG TPA: DUF4249 domain-containing protein [Puia sp.]|nr:DUF4249 domain-containing protein [Puia sp.]